LGLAISGESTISPERAKKDKGTSEEERAKITESTVKREQLATLSENTTERERSRPLEGTT